MAINPKASILRRGNNIASALLDNNDIPEQSSAAGKPYSEQPKISDKGQMPGDSKDQEEDILADYDKPFSDYQEVARAALKITIDQWKLERQQTESRRKLRYIKINVDEEKRKRNLEEDELFIPVRLCDTNIVREQAKYGQYLTQSPRNAILACIEDPAQDTSIVEKDFTEKGRYNGWEMPILKTVDGMQMHGWDGLEILFDTSKPGHFVHEHIGHDCLLFPSDTKEFQAAPFVVRLQEFSTPDLIKFVKKKGWDAKGVKQVIEANQNRNRDVNKNDDKRNKLNQVEKVFFKGPDDFVYVAWSCAEFCDDWLRPPKLCFIGKVSVDNNTGDVVKLYETAYPIEPFIYLISENEEIMSIKGRIELDEAKAEAATSLLSSFCTAHRRAAQPYFSTADGTNDGTSVEDAETSIKLKAGRLFKYPLKQFQLTPPSEGILEGINTLIGQSQMESGDVNYAVQSNKSTRKTAAEINLAQQENQLLSSVQVSLFSIALRNIYSVNFLIYSSRVKAGLIEVTPDVLQMINTFTFIVKPSGDEDVIERQQKTQLMMQMQQFMMSTGASTVFIKNFIRLLFPNEAAEYIQAIAQSDAEKALIQKMASVIQMIVIDPTTGQLRPQFMPYQQQLLQLHMMVTKALAPQPGDGAMQPQQPPNNVLQLNQDNDSLLQSTGSNNRLNNPDMQRSNQERQQAIEA